ncbi:hypothetical protein [Actinacidiphila bryophytorum]|uniref:hypothetical protein n=1 Tax=Actinacidiphila bryophytorum TaxID=1436133 RepID=UPI003FD8DB1C
MQAPARAGSPAPRPRGGRPAHHGRYGGGVTQTPTESEPLADCVLCGEPTEYPASTRGATYCPVCEWQEAQRTACFG